MTNTTWTLATIKYHIWTTAYSFHTCEAKTICACREEIHVRIDARTMPRRAAWLRYDVLLVAGLSKSFPGAEAQDETPPPPKQNKKTTNKPKKLYIKNIYFCLIRSVFFRRSAACCCSSVSLTLPNFFSLLKKYNTKPKIRQPTSGLFHHRFCSINHYFILFFCFFLYIFFRFSAFIRSFAFALWLAVDSRTCCVAEPLIYYVFWITLF